MAESGKDGIIKIGSTPIADITKWTFNKDAKAKRYQSSSTAGFSAALSGGKMGDGTIEFKWDGSVVSPIIEGSLVTLLLFLNATEKFTVPALIEKFSVVTDVDTGDVIGGTASFVNNGAWTEPTLS